MGINGLRAALTGALAATALLAGAIDAYALSPDPWASRTAPIPYSAAPSEIFSDRMPAFVTRSGSTLLLDGAPYQFAGLNIYNANNLGKCWYPLGTPAALDQALTQIGASQNAFRAWFFQPLATRNGQRDWSAFDATLAAARAHDVRVIVTLGNNLRDCEGTNPVPRTEAWYASGYATERDAGMASTYRDWVAEVVARYRDNPTILAWQLMNEAEDRTPSGGCSATAPWTMKHFAENMAALVKSIDRNHLLSLGTWGLNDCGTSGAAYQDVHSVAGIDLCEIHDYSAPSNASAPQLAQRLQQCRALNKPLFIGELGIRVWDAGSFTERAAVVQARLSTAFAAGVSGVLLWDWAGSDQVPYSGYEIQPGDPALAVLASAL